MLLMCCRPLTAAMICSCLAGFSCLLAGCQMAGIEFFPQTSSGAENAIAYDSSLATQEAMQNLNPNAMQPLIAPPPKPDQEKPSLRDELDKLLSDGRSAIDEAEGSPDPRRPLSNATRAFQSVLDANPNNAEALHGMAVVADLNQNWPAAEQYYSRALSAKPNDVDLINDLGYSYLLQNRLDDAAQVLDRALQQDPRHERANVNMAIVRVRQGNHDDALRRLTSIYATDQANSALASLVAEQSSGYPAHPVAPQAPLNVPPQIIAARPAGSGNAWQTPSASPTVPPVTAALPAPNQYSAQEQSSDSVNSAAPPTYPSVPSPSPLVARPVGGTFAIPSAGSNSGAAPPQTPPFQSTPMAPPPFHPASSATHSAQPPVAQQPAARPNPTTSGKSPEIRFPAWPAQNPAAPVSPSVPGMPQSAATPLITPGFPASHQNPSSAGLVIQPSATTSVPSYATEPGANSNSRPTPTGSFQSVPMNSAPMNSVPARSVPSQAAPTQSVPSRSLPMPSAPAYSQFPAPPTAANSGTWPTHMPPVNPMPHQTAASPVTTEPAYYAAENPPAAGYSGGHSAAAARPNPLSRFHAEQQQFGNYNRTLDQMRQPLGGSSAGPAAPAGSPAAGGRPVHVYPPGL